MAKSLGLSLAEKSKVPGGGTAPVYFNIWLVFFVFQVSRSAPTPQNSRFV